MDEPAGWPGLAAARHPEKLSVDAVRSNTAILELLYHKDVELRGPHYTQVLIFLKYLHTYEYGITATNFTAVKLLDESAQKHIFFEPSESPCLYYIIYNAYSAASNDSVNLQRLHRLWLFNRALMAHMQRFDLHTDRFYQRLLFKLNVVIYQFNVNMWYLKQAYMQLQLLNYLALTDSQKRFVTGQFARLCMYLGLVPPDIYTSEKYESPANEAFKTLVNDGPAAAESAFTYLIRKALKEHDKYLLTESFINLSCVYLIYGKVLSQDYYVIEYLDYAMWQKFTDSVMRKFE